VINKPVHAYIAASPSQEARKKTALEISAALVCSGPREKPCRECRSCRLALAELHPDIMTVTRGLDDHGKLRREVYVEQIRDVVSNAHIMPTDAERRVFVIEDAGFMNHAAQNALLKVLEEPPDSSAFVLCVERTDLLLPTVRSRCLEITTTGDEKEYPGETRLFAAGFADLYLSGKTAERLRFCVSNEGMDSEKLREFLECLKEEAALRLRSGAGTAAAELVSLADKALLYARRNVGIRHIFGILAAG